VQFICGGFFIIFLILPQKNYNILVKPRARQKIIQKSATILRLKRLVLTFNISESLVIQDLSLYLGRI